MSVKDRRFLELIPADLNIDFVGLRRTMVGLSVVLVAGSIMALLTLGLNYGIDFAGGTMVHVRFPDAMATAAIREAVQDEGDLQGVVVQDVGGDGREFQIRVPTADDASTEHASGAVRAALAHVFGEGTYDVLRVESVGPKVGRDLWRDATLAVLAATVMMGIYLAVRFDLRFGLGAAVALAHDVALTLGALALTQMDFDLTTVAALLTVVGFSVNDTVVISDRIRESLITRKRAPLPEIVNRAINETMSRTLITSGTAVMVILALFFVGGSVIHSFAFTLLVGFVFGTYSSIYIAAPVVLALESRRSTRPVRAR
jgi:preprotein translocase subunit SecF